MLIDSIVMTTKDILNADIDLISRLAAARKRFENWLQIEIFKRLMVLPNSVEVEWPYPESTQRCDFRCGDDDGQQSFVELKVCVTNYVGSFGARTTPRPITNQISDIIADVTKLRMINIQSCNRYVFLLAYPLPIDFRVHTEWGRHIERIRSCGTSIQEVLSVNMFQDEKVASLVGYVINVEQATL